MNIELLFNIKTLKWIFKNNIHLINNIQIMNSELLFHIKSLSEYLQIIFT